MLLKSEDDYTEDDYAHLKRSEATSTGTLSRCGAGSLHHQQDDSCHLTPSSGFCVAAQRPDKSEEELDHMKWTYSLENWGHDPLRTLTPTRA